MLGLGLKQAIGENPSAMEINNECVLEFKTDNLSDGSSNDDQVKLPLYDGGVYDSFKIRWGDGTSDIISAWNQAEVTHTYPASGTYKARITGKLTGFRFNNAGDKEKLISVTNNNPDFKLGDLGAYFYGCNKLLTVIGLKTEGMTNFWAFFANCNIMTQNLSYLNTDSATNMSFMLQNCDGIVNGCDFNTENVTDMSNMFYGCNNFNQALTYDTGKVTTMSNMFYGCTSLNSLLTFNTTSVTNMGNMFNGCTSFNQSLSSFDTSKVEYFTNMFNGCTSFNQSVSNFDTSSAINMYAMFYNCSVFNQSVSNFDTSSVTTMYAMFLGCLVFNQSVSNFDTSLVTNMGYMFYNCIQFNQSVSNFDTGLVTNMQSMFYNCQNFNQDISSFDISLVTNMTGFALLSTAWSTANYSAALIAWNAGTHQDSVTFECASYYSADAADEHLDFINNHSWSFTDLGQAA